MQVLHKAGSWTDGDKLGTNPPEAKLQTEVQNPDRVALVCELLCNAMRARHGAAHAVLALYKHDVKLVLGNNMQAYMPADENMSTCDHASSDFYTHDRSHHATRMNMLTHTHRQTHTHGHAHMHTDTRTHRRRIFACFDTEPY